MRDESLETRGSLCCSLTSCLSSLASLVWRTDLLSQRTLRQYLRRCRVSRPGSGWSGVAPRRTSHATGSGASTDRQPKHSPSLASHTPHVFPQGSPRPCAPVASTCHHASSSGRSPRHLRGDLPV